MQVLSIVRFIGMGTCLRYLQDITPENKLGGKGGIKASIQILLNGFENHSMTVSLRAADDLEKFLKKIKKYKKRKHLTPKQCQELRRIITFLRKTVRAEARGIFTFITKEKRYLTDRLLGGVGLLLAPGVFDKMPEIAQEDFNSAGKCIAFEMSTAAAFHLLRGTEGVVGQFYRSVVKRNRHKTLIWGPMIKQMRERSNPPPKEILDQLDSIRGNFRNPTQHPEKNYDIEEAQSLFGVCIDAIERMVKYKGYDPKA